MGRMSGRRFDVIVPVTISMSVEDMDDNVLGSGAGTYSWWVSIEKNDSTGAYLLEAEDPDYEEGSGRTITKMVTPEGIVQAMEQAAEDFDGLARRILDEDLDASDVDVVLQIALFGEVIFS